jgi:hypothetical protein
MLILGGYRLSPNIQSLCHWLYRGTRREAALLVAEKTIDEIGFAGSIYSSNGDD